jgi:hypothetical protein
MSAANTYQDQAKPVAQGPATRHLLEIPPESLPCPQQRTASPPQSAPVDFNIYYPMLTGGAPQAQQFALNLALLPVAVRLLLLLS